MIGEGLLAWLSTRGRSSVPAASRKGDGEPITAVAGSAPSMPSLLRGLRRDQNCSVLDLGAANDTNLSEYSRFARHVRFADLLPLEGGRLVEWEEALSLLPLEPQHPYDLVFAWNILDRLLPEQRPELVERLVELTAPGARLHVVVEMSDVTTVNAHRFSFGDLERMRFHRSNPVPRERAPLLPGEVERLLEPFEVISAFTLKAGFREYVARLRPGDYGTSLAQQAWHENKTDTPFPGEIP